MRSDIGTRSFGSGFLAAVLTFGWMASLGAAAHARVDEDVVLQWNRVVTTTVRTPGVQPPTIMGSRTFAMVHLAMFDAVNSIDGTHKPYLTDVPGSKNASINAAAAQAARDVLVGLYPALQSTFDAELAISLEGIPENRAEQGIRVGRIVAERMLAHRANDGWSATPPAYSLPADPGNWQPTPPAFAPPALTHYGAVTPFATTSIAQFRPPPPPSLTSAVYTADFNEVKALGSATSATRTADQTLVARLFGNRGNVGDVWTRLAIQQAIAHELSTVQMARLFGLLTIINHDALQTSWGNKYYYGLWRQVDAIRRADEDGNPDTIADPAWTPLIVTPPYPTYPGNAATDSAARATMLGLFFGRDDIPFSATIAGPPETTRSYEGFWALANEDARSRVYGGIHFTFDNTAGQSIGRNVSNYVFQNFLTPRSCNLNN